jgi:hydroxymethylpyrimidine/phosphomethylpyrimidine kinase
MSVHVALTIAASDSGGGSGLQGDLKTFEALGVYGATAVTAVLARNTTGITAIHDLPAAVVRDQVRAVLSDLPPGAIKVGMLSTIPVIRAIAAELRRTPAPVVLDPVMISRDGARLLRATSVSSLIKDLLPRASIVTPNLPEASLLAGFPIRNESDAKRAARAIQALGPQAVLIKGGHGEGPSVVDGLLDGRTWHLFQTSRLETRHTYGTGCALSSAITAWLARGETLPEAVEKALKFVRRAIEEAPGLGSGQGPIGHKSAGEGSRRGPDQSSVP